MKHYHISLLAAGFAALCTLTMSADITDAIPASKPNPEAQAWSACADRPALMEALSRTPGFRFDDKFASSPFKAMPIEGQAMPSPQADDAIARIVKGPRRVIPGGTNLTAYMGYNTMDLETGFYTVPLTNSADFVEQSTLPTIESSGLHGGTVTPNYAIFSYQGIYVQNGEYSGYTAIVDRSNWQVLGNVGDYGEYGRWASDMTYDPTTNRVYGCFMDNTASYWELGYMQIDDANPGNAVNEVRHVGKLESSLNGIACDAQGVLWGIRADDGALVTISRKTGEMTFVASTGIVPRYNGTLAWDNSQHILYWTLCYDQGSEVRSALCTVDPETGKVEYVNNFDGYAAQLGALGADFVAKNGAPAQAANLAANFDGFDYSGTVTFDVPATLESGEVATGDVQATLVVTAANREEAFTASIAAAYGATGVSIPVTLEKTGNYTFTVSLANEVGQSYPASVTRYVGIDYPCPIANVGIDCAGGKVTVTWPAVTEPLYGGYFNPDELVYKVVVQQTDVTGQSATLYNGTTVDCSVEVDVDDTNDLRAFRATVTPVVSEVAGQQFKTEWIWFGYYAAPFGDAMTTAGAWTTQTIYGGNWISTSQGWAIPYNWGVYNNSWLFSPAVMLQEGEVYNISVNAYSEIVVHTGKLSMGRAANADAMTTDLCNISVPTKHTNKYEAVITCEETGLYYFGILNDTRSDTWTNVPNVYFTNFKVEAVSHAAPAAPGLTVERDPNGGYEVPVTVTIPSKTHGGDTLEGELSMVLKRGSTVLLEKASVSAGEVIEYADTVDADGSYTYSAIVTNDVAQGVPALVTAFIGAGLPVDPEWVSSAEGEEIGTVEVAWSPVTVNTQDMPIAPEALTYNVMNILSDTYVQRGVTDSNFSYRACEEGEQEGVYISVNAQTNSGTSSLYGKYSQEGILFVGTPASLPMVENFGPGKLSLPWLTVNQSSGADGFTVCDMMAQEGIMDANGDGNALLGFCPYLEGSVCLYSGMIEVPADVTAPALSYAVLNTNFGNAENNNGNIVSIYIIGDKTSGMIDQYKLKSMPLGWNYRYIDLAKLKGERVHIMIQLYTLSYTTYYFDDIQLFDRAQTDLKITSLSVPAAVKPDSRFNITVNIINDGLSTVKQADNATVELLRDGQVIDSKPVATSMLSLATLKNRSLTFDDKLQLADAPGAKYTARIVFDGDMLPDNNELTASARIVLPNVPAPVGVQGTRDAEGFPEISWEAPDLTPVYESTLAMFEDFQGYSLMHLCGFSTFELTGNVKDISNFETAHGFEVMYYPQLAHSGNCFLMSTACKDGAAKEDWLVSPKLSGRAQTVTFYVSTNWDAHENFCVYASTAGDQRDDFGDQPIFTGRTLSNNWQQISIDLPEGTTHFAIVAKAEDTADLMMLMIDDVVYEGMPANANLDLKGYRVYRDRESLDEEPIEAHTIVDNAASLGGHSYRVSALYDGVESAPTDEIYVFSRGGAPADGIEAVNVDGATITTEPGLIKIATEAPAAIALYDFSGRAICQTTIDGAPLAISVPAAPYILTINGTPYRLLVK